jgi:hypothetical protein
MAKPPHRPRTQSRKSALTQEALASRAVVQNKRDPRQAGIFDRPLPAFVRPQLGKLVTEAPAGQRWAHELKFDGYRMRARIDRGRVQLITARSGLDWTSKYPATAEALKKLPVARAFLDGELCVVRPEGGEGTRLWRDDLAGLLGLMEMGVIELHPWSATIGDIERPDTLVFDLDPGDGIEWPFVQDTALRLREMFERDEGLGTWPKLTGGKGAHIMVPIERDLSWDAAHDYCRRLAERFTKKRSKTLHNPQQR